MNQEERTLQLATLVKAGLTLGECIAAFADPEDDPYVVAAHDMQRDGELEIDNPTVVSRGAPDGAYVMAWVWVSNADAGLPDDAEDDEETDEAEQGEPS